MPISKEGAVHAARTTDFRRVDPEIAGFSGERLARLDQRFSEGVETGEIPGAVVMILRKGEVAYERAFGFSDRPAGVSMTMNTVFWLASMTKPITSVAAMMLVEEGGLDLNADVALYLPELADLQVAGPDKARAPQRAPKVHDLMRHTAGFVYGEFGNSPLHGDYVAANLFDRTASGAAFVEKLSRLTLAHEPGQTFEYSVATDVLGRVVEVIAGEPLEAFIERRIAAPLGMASLSAVIPPDKPYAFDDAFASGPARMGFEAAMKIPPQMLSGGGGLFGVAEDYARFAQMLLNRGAFAGATLLSPATVAHMTANHLPDGVDFDAGTVALLDVLAPVPAMGQGFGLGFAVRTDPGLHPAAGSVGDFYWAGAGGTYFWVDPVEELVVVMLTAQSAHAPKVRFRQLIRALVYQALIVSLKGPDVVTPGSRIQDNAGGHSPVSTSVAGPAGGLRP